MLAVALKATVILLAAWAGAALLRRATPAARHHAWALGVAGALLVPLLAWLLPPLAAPRALERTSAAALRSVETTVAATVEATAAWVGAGEVRAPSLPSSPSSPGAASLLAALWAAGALVVGARVLRAHLAAGRLVRGAGESHREDGVVVARSEAIGSPMTIGVLRPRVLLPAAADAWSAERRRAVMLHELGHVARRDTLVQLIAQLACVAYWWNPLAWLAAARLRRERELACDDLVLAAGTRPSSYAEALLEVVRGSTGGLAAPVGMVGRSSTALRLRRILDGAAARRPLGRGARVSTAALALGLAAAVACASPPTEPAVVARAPARAPKAPAAAPAVEVGAPRLDRFDQEVPWSLAPEHDLADVVAELESRRPELTACYARVLATRPDALGAVVVNWQISPGGLVTAFAYAQNDFRGEALEAIDACVSPFVRSPGFAHLDQDGPLYLTLPLGFGRSAPEPGC
jgi:beta-lactamase regulating signal transducer with metallopeptidase domain